MSKEISEEFEKVIFGVYKFICKQIMLRVFNTKKQHDTHFLYTGLEYDMANIVIYDFPEKLLSLFKENFPKSSFDLDTTKQNLLYTWNSEDIKKLHNFCVEWNKIYKN